MFRQSQMSFSIRKNKCEPTIKMAQSLLSSDWERQLWLSKRISYASMCLFVSFIRRSIRRFGRSLLFLFLFFVFFVLLRYSPIPHTCRIYFLNKYQTENKFPLYSFLKGTNFTSTASHCSFSNPLSFCINNNIYYYYFILFIYG